MPKIYASFTHFCIILELVYEWLAAYGGQRPQFIQGKLIRNDSGII